ncbi:hypothetical protein [Streptomyces sp. VRA16 Mangrove soil]|uniref:hypothetical protein n=1 Tax=Streptomyces sp. VRA16 Mangrove soil TaxID=2817434 RepID=UPI001A9ED7EA|nr:hypothetical protein [Streptomyces sp. VRA16 Mangrove soil]MBO1337164.1 hypothetical protein [Streptomyces sp. VRA16 Mangrove soil]
MEPTTPPSLSAGATRMLLSSDGSTTTLLEALLDCSLTVRVHSQGPVQAQSLYPRARLELGLAPGDTAVERHSALLAPSDDVVSVNVVSYAAPPSGWSGSSADSAPLGRRLREAGTKQHRRILSSGISEWPGDDAHQPCAYKEYIIACEDGSQLYVMEKFNPAFVAADTRDTDDRVLSAATAV